MIAASPSLKMNRSYLRVLCILFITKCNLEKKINHFKTSAQKPVTVNPHINCRWGFMWFAVGTQVKILFTTK